MSTVLEEPAVTAAGYPPVILRLRPIVEISDDQLYEIAIRNPELRIERSKEGELELKSPVGGAGSDRNAELTMQLRGWAKNDGRGTAFDSSCGFILPDGAMLSPDGAWVAHDRLNLLTIEQREKFLPLCPEFVAEIRSRTDSLRTLMEKMREFIDNGAKLGWLIDPQQKRVYVYRPGREPQILENPDAVSGEEVLPGFNLDLRDIW